MFLDRKGGESFTTPPTVEKKLRLRFNKNNLHFTTESLSVVNPETTPETIPDASGAAGGTELDSAELFIKPWNWVSTKNADGSVVTSKSPDKFVLTFTAPNSFGATTDCNGIGGNFEATGETVTFSNMISTMMFCEGSQESEFNSALSKVASYELNQNNELVLKLNDGGMMNFK